MKLKLLILFNLWLLAIMGILLFTSFSRPVEPVIKSTHIQLYFVIDEGHRTAIVYEYTLTGDTLIPLHIPDHVMASMKVK
jgi:hypothetical protein